MMMVMMVMTKNMKTMMMMMMMMMMTSIVIFSMRVLIALSSRNTQSPEPARASGSPNPRVWLIG